MPRYKALGRPDQNPKRALRLQNDDGLNSFAAPPAYIRTRPFSSPVVADSHAKSQAGRRGFEPRLPLHIFNHLRGLSTPSKPSV